MSHPAGRTVGPVARLLRLLVLAYRLAVSPLLGPRCRFAPTCSAYALDALEAHGALRGSWLAVRRVARCHPFSSGGHDPVPPARRPRGLADVCVPSSPVAGAAGPRVSETGGRSGPGPTAVPEPSHPPTRLGAPS